MKLVTAETLAAALQSASMYAYRSGVDYGSGSPIKWEHLHEQERTTLLSEAAAILAAIPPDPRLDALLAALRSEDEIAHGEAWDDERKRGLGVCAYCDDEWPCRTQQGIDRALAAFEEPV